MISLFISLAVLFVGYILYGNVAEKVFSPDDRATPAVTVNDGVDKGKYRFGSLISSLPATFMTAVSITYILMAKEGFRINQTVSYIAGITVAVVLFSIYLFFLFNRKR